MFSVQMMTAISISTPSRTLCRWSFQLFFFLAIRLDQHVSIQCVLLAT